MIEKVVLENYRCFRSLQLSLRPMTVLIGPNGVGKSAVLDGVRAALDGAHEVVDARNIHSPDDLPAYVEVKTERRVFRRNLEEASTSSLGKVYALGPSRNDETSTMILSDCELGEATDLLQNTLYILESMGVANAINIHSPQRVERGQKPRLYARSVSACVSFVVPIVLTMLRATAGDVVVIENPELGLHPIGQVRLGQLMSSASAGGVQFLLETHSEHILNGIRRAVCVDGIVGTEHVLVHQFTTLGAGASEEIELLPNGTFTGTAMGFFDQFDNDLRAILSTRSFA